MMKCLWCGRELKQLHNYNNGVINEQYQGCDVGCCYLIWKIMTLAKEQLHTPIETWDVLDVRSVQPQTTIEVKPELSLDFEL